MSFCVYIHRKKTDGTPFYVGKGSIRRSKTRCERSVLWHRFADKYGFYCEIFANFIDENSAFYLEKYLIKMYGRLDNKTGILVNHTDGGEGSSGYRHTDEAKRKISLASKSISSEIRKKISAARVGTVESKETRMKKSNSMIGNLSGRIKKPKEGSMKGVSFHKKTGKWLAKITVNYKQIYLGIFLDKIEAAIVYDDAAFANWGHNCYINFPNRFKGTVNASYC